MKAPANCRLIGRWRIVEADLWDRAHLDLCGPAALTITAQGGEIAFGALEAGLEVEYARDSIGFHWAGCEEGDEVDGEGTAELLDDGEIEFAYHNGDQVVLKAKRVTSSTACQCSPPREKHVERQRPHARGRVEGVGHLNEEGAVRLDQLDSLANSASAQVSRSTL